jgi:hypothetical protein
MKEEKKKRGGYRPNARRPRFLEGGAYTPTYLDEPTREGMRRLGRGHLSEGIRLALIMIDNLPDGARAALEIKSRKIQEERSEALRERQFRKELK